MDRIDTIKPASLYRLGAIAAILGGGLRIASSFVPYAPGSMLLEALYAVIDVFLLFGLAAIYLSVADRVGRTGLLFFSTAIAAIASIVGPDATLFGIDFYRLGATLIAGALSGASILLLRESVYVASAVLWLATLAAGLIIPAWSTDLAQMVAGLLFGAGFAVAGIALLRKKPDSANFSAGT